MMRLLLVFLFSFLNNFIVEAASSRKPTENESSMLLAVTEVEDRNLNHVNETLVRHAERNLVSVCIKKLSGNKIIRNYDKPITPKKLYAELRKEEGLAWTDNQYYILTNRNREMINPLSNQELAVGENILELNIVFESLDEDQLAFIEHDHKFFKNGRFCEFYRNYFVMYYAVQQHTGSALQHASDSIRRDKEINWRAVLSDGNALEYVLVSLLDKDICLAAFQSNACALEYIPENLKSYELCLAAVQLDGNALEFVPVDLVNEEMCLAAFRSNACALEYVPENLKSYEMCLAAVHQCGYALLAVPVNFRNKKMCLAAVKSNGNALNFISESLKDREICLTAVRSKGEALQYVPENLRDEEICIAAAQSNSWSLGHLPKNSRDQKMCLTAVLIENFWHLITYTKI